MHGLLSEHPDQERPDYIGPTQAKGNGLDFPIPVGGLVIDIYILVLPLIGVYDLHLSTRRKIGIGMIFFTAIIAVVASILRIVYTFWLTKGIYGDLTYNVMPVFLTITVEATLGVTITCVPAFSHMLHHTLPSYDAIRSRSTSRLYKFRGSRTKSAPGIGSGYQDKLSNQVSGDTGTPSAFIEAEGPHNPVVDYELGQVKPVKTHISGKRDKEIDEDGIHLKYDLRQGWHEGPRRPSGSMQHHGTKEPDAMSEAVETHIV